MNDFNDLNNLNDLKNFDNFNNIEEINPETKSQDKKRFYVVIVFLAAVFIITTIRLFYVTVIKSTDGNNSGRLRNANTLRGIIYDRNKFKLAISVLRYSIAIKPKKIRGNIENFKKDILVPLAEITKKTEEKILEILDKHYDANLVYLSKKVKLTDDQLKKLYTMQGVLLFKEYDRKYPYGSLASHVIGITGRNDKGLEGIEYHYESLLKEKADLVGADIVLSIDRDIQSVMEKELSKTVLKENAESGTVIIMNVKNGDILGMANYPDYNLQEYRSLSRVEFIKKSKNLAVSSSDEIGSSFKAFIIAILSELNLIDLNKVYDCNGEYKVPGGKVIKDTAVYGKIKFPKVVKYSSNVGMIEAAMNIPKKKYYNYLKLLGFMEKTGIDLPYENTKVFRSYDKFRNQARASVAIGQEIGVTPIQVITAAASIVNGGYLIRPRIVRKILRNNKVIKNYKVKIKRKIFKNSTCDMVWRLLKKVMERGGTGYKGNIVLNGRRLNIVGKTGTAQVFDPRIRTYSNTLRNNSFLGFISRPRNTYAVFVIVRKPKRDPVRSTGGTVAVPLFRKIITKILDRHGSRLP